MREGAVAFAKALLLDGAGVRRTSERKVDPATRDAGDHRTADVAGEASQYPNRTAALTAIEAVSAAARLPFEEGLLYEEKLANQTKATVEVQGVDPRVLRRTQYAQGRRSAGARQLPQDSRAQA